MGAPGFDPPPPPPPPPEGGPGRISYALPPPPPLGGVGGPGYPVPPLGGGWSALWDAVASIRKGLGHYRIVLLLEGLVAALNAAFVLLLGGSGQNLSSIAAGGSPSLGAGAMASGASLGYAVVTGGVALVAVVLTIVAWSEWRSGLKALLGSSGERGEEYRSEVVRSERFYTATLVAFFLNIVGSVVLVAALLFASVSIQPGANGSAPMVAVVSNSTFQASLLAVVIFSGAVNLVLYYCASRSLVGTVRLLVGPIEREALETARGWILVGALLTPATSAAVLFVGWASVAAVVPPLLLVLGYTRLITVYDGWLSSRAAPPTTSWRPLAPS